MRSRKLSCGSLLVSWFVLLVGSLFACRIEMYRPIPIRPIPRPIPPLPPVKPILTQEHHADVVIKDNVVNVTVSAIFHNPNPRRMEGTYFFPLDASATVSSFSMVINGKETQAELLPADKARQIYEDIVRRQKDPGLLEFVGTKMLKARVFPIEPNGNVKIKMQYQQALKADAGLFHFRYPLRSARPHQGSIKQVTVNVRIESSVPIKTVYTPSHKADLVRSSDNRARLSYEATSNVPERDFDVYFSRDTGDVGLSLLAHKPSNEDGYFLLSIAPKVELPKDKAQPKNIVFVLDTSGSMSGKKIEQAKNALAFCVNNLNPGDKFDIIGFSTEARPFKPSLVPFSKALLEEARQYISGIRARGGTAIDEALTMAVNMVTKEKGLSMIVFLTDGRPTIGESNIDKILANVRSHNSARARVFVFGLGYDVNTDLLDRLAEENSGAKEYVVENEDIEVKVSSFYNKISYPVLSDVRLAFNSVQVRDMYPKRLPDLFRGSQLMVLGRYRGLGQKTLILSGTVNGQPKEFKYKVMFGEKETNEFLPRIWANRKVAYLLNEIKLRGKNKELVDEVIALGKRYGIVTPYTSFLVIEEGVGSPIRDEIASARKMFEKADTGAYAVQRSRELKAAQNAVTVPPAGPGPGGFGFGKRKSAEVVARLVRQKVHHIFDKTFFLKKDGVLYDSLFKEDDKDKIIDIEFMSDNYFELVRKFPVLGKYFAAGKNMVICFGGNIYRVKAD